MYNFDVMLEGFVFEKCLEKIPFFELKSKHKTKKASLITRLSLKYNICEILKRISQTQSSKKWSSRREMNFLHGFGFILQSTFRIKLCFFPTNVKQVLD